MCGGRIQYRLKMGLRELWGMIKYSTDLPGGSVIKNRLPSRRHGSVSGLGRSPGGENGNPLQYSCLGNPTDRLWARVPRAAVHGVAKESDTT